MHKDIFLLEGNILKGHDWWGRYISVEGDNGGGYSGKVSNDSVRGSWYAGDILFGLHALIM